MALPDIIISGAQKCGTSTLHRWLVEQANVSPPIDPETKRPIKEVHFFTNNWQRGLAWYESHFAGNRSVDASPNYLSDTRAHARLRSVHANARVVVCLRDPIDRAYSQYNHYKQELPQSASYDWQMPDGDFHTNVLAELLDGIDEHAQVFRGLIARGLYLPQIQSLMAHFGADQVHLTIMERWETHPEVVAQLADFLHVGTPDKLPVAHKRAYTVEAMEQRTEDALSEAFRPYSDRLFEYLGFDVPEWR